MKNVSFLFAFFIAVLPLVFTTTGCFNNKITSVEREDLFTLEIGPMEDQIALYHLEGSRGIRRTGFTMQDGLFYIADGNSGKIVRFNSFGDLLFMIYNEEKNPVPFILKTNVPEDEHVTRWAYTYPLEEPGWIAVNSQKHIFVEDRLPQQAHRKDQESKALLDGIILHFDQDGRFINYLGREGIGGTPFPRIIGMSTSTSDELTVICRLPNGWNVYWFSSSGNLLYLIKLNTGAIPPLKDWPEAMTFVESITADPDSRRIYLKVDYSRFTYDQSTNTRSGSEPIISVIWILDVEDGTYKGSVELPLYELTENGHSINIKVFYSMLGAMSGGKVLLYFPVDTGYSILLTDTNLHEHRRGYINFSYDELMYNDFYLSADGILCAMLADNYTVKIVWWRTGNFMGKTK